MGARPYCCGLPPALIRAGARIASGTGKLPLSDGLTPALLRGVPRSVAGSVHDSGNVAEKCISKLRSKMLTLDITQASLVLLSLNRIFFWDFLALFKESSYLCSKKL